MKRDLQFDIVRVIATLWIIGVWHMLDFADAPRMWEIKGELGYVTTCMLAVFMFISGYFLSKYTFDTKEEILYFYKKRMTRFFPLFVISALLLYRLGFNPRPMQLVFTLTGLSSYIGNQSGTIWFISMLFSFYMLTPFVTKALQKLNKVYIKTLAVILFSVIFIYTLSCTSLDYDNRLTYTMPFYGLGLIYGREQIVKTLSGKWYVFLISLVLLFVLFHFGFVGKKFMHIETVTAIIILLCVCHWLKYLPIGRVVNVLSYASMAMYLFHEQIFHLTNKFILHCYKCEILEFYLILMPLMIVLSYLIQYIYDYCIKKMYL